LARLRPFTTTTINTKTDYRLPVGGWFEWVTCPHYFAEILIYVAFAVLLELEQHGSPQNRLWLRLRPVLLVVWVVTNLTLSAWQSHEWYVQHVADYARLGRSAIVPFLL
jgi:3-oxo-5-alpha-steroid 4-dehydrogenase 3